MLTYHLIECIDNYTKTLGSLREYLKDDPNDNNRDSESFKLKVRIEIVVPMKYLNNFWGTLEMLLINCNKNSC